MTDDQLKKLYARSSARRASQSGECRVPPEEMVALLEGRLSGSERVRVMLAISSDPKCEQEFQLLRAMTAGAPPEFTRRPVRWTRVLALAASLTLVAGAGVIWRREALRSAPEPIRDQVGAELVLVAPAAVATSGSAVSFVWHAVPGSVRFDYDLTTPEGEAVYSTTLADTVLVLPDSVHLSADRDYVWWVEANLRTGERLRSDVRRLRIASP